MENKNVKIIDSGIDRETLDILNNENVVASLNSAEKMARFVFNYQCEKNLVT